MGLQERRLESWRIRGTLLALSTALSVLFLEAACRVYALAFRSETQSTYSEFLATQPEAYKGADISLLCFSRNSYGHSRLSLHRRVPICC